MVLTATPNIIELSAFADDKQSLHQTMYSICTIVNNHEIYSAMRESFLRNGFSSERCEFLLLDNSHENTIESYRAYNKFMTAARGDVIILCHQDVEVLQSISDLDRLLSELNVNDSNWAVIGNAGVNREGQRCVRITDPHHGEIRTDTIFPARVCSLDENFIAVRKQARLSVSHDLAGFHLPATEICLIADILGWSSYVIDFHVLHKSRGTVDAGYIKARREFEKKYQRAFRARSIMMTTGHHLLIGYSPASRMLTGAKLWILASLWPTVRLFSRRSYQKIKGRLLVSSQKKTTQPSSGCK